MMKNIKTKKINVKRLTLIAVCLIVVGIAGELLVGVGDSRYITLEQTANIIGVTDVHVTARSQRINVIPIDGSEVRVVSSGIPKDMTLTVEVNDTVLNVQTDWPQLPSKVVEVGGLTELFNNVNNQPTLTVYLPNQVYESIEINGTSGRIEISEYTVSELLVDNLSGRINVSDIEGDVAVNGTSGSIEVQNVTGNAIVSGMSGRINVSDINGNLNVKGTSGEIEVGNVTGNAIVSGMSGRMNLSDIKGNLNVKGTSGNITLSDISGDIDVNNMSGSIRLNNETLAQNVNLQGTSGRIEVILSDKPENASFSLSSLSGRTEIFGDRSTSARFGDGRYEVMLSTMSGRVTVE